MGIDIVRGSPLSHTSPPLYAVVIINDRYEVLYEALEVPLRSVIRIAWDFKVDRIGVDNVFELAPTRKQLGKVFELIPAHTLIYQVTLENGKFVDLLRQAEKIGVHVSSKPRPLQTAYIIALLTLNGIGTVIRGVSTRTKIIVSRARSPGSGGSRANIFARGMRTAVLRAVKEIRKRLEDAQIFYDIVLKRGKGGLDNAVIIAYADTETVRKLVKPFHGSDVRVVIKPIFSGIEFEGEEQVKKPIIVGVDPGIETGIAVIDLSLRFCHTFSSKEFDKLSIISKVYSLGTPVLVATDKNPPPDTVKKIASMLGVQLYVPSVSLSIKEKEELINWAMKRGVAIDIKTPHERDALAAALKAYKAFEKKFVEIERKVAELGLDVDVDELKLQLLKGKTVNEVLEYAIEEHLTGVYAYVTAQGANANRVQGVSETVNCDDRIKALEEKLNELFKEREVLRSRVIDLERRLQELEFAKRFDFVNIDVDTIKDRIVNELREQLRQLRALVTLLEEKIKNYENERKELIDVLRGVATGALVLVPVANSITPNNVVRISGANVLYLSKGVIDLNALKDIEKPLILILDKCSVMSAESLLDLQVVPICDVSPVTVLGDIAVFDRRGIEEAVSKGYNYLADYIRKKREATAVDLKKLRQIIEEYRRSLIKNTNSSNSSK
jgi:hypothetical protein